MTTSTKQYTSTLPNGLQWTATTAGHLAAWTQWREACARALRTGEGVMLKVDEHGYAYIEMVYSIQHFRAAWAVRPDGRVEFVGEGGDGDHDEWPLKRPTGLPWATVEA